MKKIFLKSLMVIAALFSGCSKSFQNKTPLEVAQDPAAYGFKQGGTIETTPNEAGLRLGLEPSKNVQWTKEASDGKRYVLTIHYDKDGKLASAKWGGF